MDGIYIDEAKNWRYKEDSPHIVIKIFPEANRDITLHFFINRGGVPYMAIYVDKFEEWNMDFVIEPNEFLGGIDTPRFYRTLAMYKECHPQYFTNEKEK